MTDMRLSYNDKANEGTAGAACTLNLDEVVTAANLSRKGFTFDVSAVQNTTLYRVAVAFMSKASATFGQTTTVNCDYTSDGTATEAEIQAGVLAAINAAAVPVKANLLDAANGPIQVYAKQVDQDFTLTVSANLTTPVADDGSIPFGVVVCPDVSDPTKCRLPFTDTDVAAALGVALRTLAMENPADGTAKYPLSSLVNIAREGRLFVTVEEDVLTTDDVYVRFATKGSNTQRGAFRKSPDGTAQVTELTPTAVNSTIYSIQVNGYAYSYTSDGTATVAEIVAGFIALINAQTAQHGVVASDGTTKLILTANVAGIPFTSSVGANIASSTTTANVATAAKHPRLKFAKAATAGNFAKLDLNLP